MKNKNIKLAITTCLILGFAYQADAQTTSQKIGTNPTTKDASAILELEATNKGVLFPRVTLTSLTDVTTVPNAVNALTVFNTATTITGTNDVTPGYYYWSVADTKWVRLVTGSALADVRSVGTNNHITQDAGVGGSGSSAGTGANNILLGLNSGTALTAGSGNVALGRDALGSNSVGDYNVAIGVNSLRNNTATQNVGVGVGSLQQTTTGGYNVAMGNQSLSGNEDGVSNTAIGSFALQSNVGGNANVGLGRNSLDGNISGSNNVAIGNVAGSTLTSGDRNIFIGQNVQPNISPTSSNQLNIGNWIYGDDGKIGINEPAPNSTLSVTGSISTSIRLVSASTMLTENDHTIIISNPITVNSPWQTPFPAISVDIKLPQASTCKGRIYEIYNQSGSQQRVITFDGPYGTAEIKRAPGGIDGTTTGYYLGPSSITFGDEHMYSKVQSDGVVWWAFYY